MTVTADYERMLEALRGAGCRITAPRRALLELITGTDQPLSVPEMHTEVNRRITGTDTDEVVNLVTVYRFANLLVELGLARRVELGQGYARYEREERQDGPHHHHLVCERCGKIEDFHGCDVGLLAARLETESGFKIVRHQLELYGTCPQCQSPG